MPADDIVSTLDVKNNLLRINESLFGVLSDQDQRRVMSTTSTTLQAS